MVTKYLPLYYNATKMRNNSDFLIFDPSAIGVRSQKSKHIIRNKDNSIIAVNIITKKQNGKLEDRYVVFITSNRVSFFDL